MRLLGAEAFDVDGDRGQDMLDVRPGCAPVAAAAHLMRVGQLVDRALDAGACGVEAPPLRILLVGAVLGLQVVEAAGEDVHGASLAWIGRACAPAAVGAGGALPGVERHEGVGRLGGRLGPIPAGLPGGAGDLTAVGADGEVLAGEAGDGLARDLRAVESPPASPRPGATRCLLYGK